ncbi:hypothetical protein N9W55_02945 [Amylibacter sp.]|nr:hypothetical protein [Amylibacter sp.]
MKFYNIYLNEPDFYEQIDFLRHPEIQGVFRPGDNIPYNKIDAVMVGLKDVIDDDFLASFPNINYVVSNTTGVDHIQTNRDVQIVHLNPAEIESVTATAEFSLALLLSLVRKIPFIDPENVSDRKTYRGTQLSGLHLGIIGLGRLGKKMARFAEALDMKWSSFDKDSTEAERVKLFTESDIISIHIPLLENTVDFVSFEEFAMMDRQPYVINSSRPQIINKSALLDALDRDLIKGLAMDFINFDASSEWDPELNKYQGNKLLLTPHLGGNTQESVTYTAKVILSKWLSLLND